MLESEYINWVVHVPPPTTNKSTRMTVQPEKEAVLFSRAGRINGSGDGGEKE